MSRGPADDRARLDLLLRMVDLMAAVPGWDDADTATALVLLATRLIHGRDAGAIARLTGVPRAAVNRIHLRLERLGRWSPDGSLEVRWGEPRGGALAFFLDVRLVREGAGAGPGGGRPPGVTLH